MSGETCVSLRLRAVIHVRRMEQRYVEEQVLEEKFLSMLMCFFPPQNVVISLEICWIEFHVGFFPHLRLISVSPPLSLQTVMSGSSDKRLYIGEIQ